MATGRRGLAKRLFVTRLRRWLLAGVFLLLAVLAGLVGYARYRMHRLMADLPHRLGIDIKSETNGFTYSQSMGGRTVFTLHAAKAVQRENGKTTLHDVAITLYGPKGSNQTDSIRGDEFEYDQPNGVVRAMGEVHLDLAAPQQPGTPVRSGAKRIQVTTSGLVFLQKLGVAATDKPIQVIYGDLHGGANGADYVSDTGVLRLRSDVRMDGVENGQQVHVDASSAEVDRNAMTANLTSAHVQSGTSRAYGDAVKLDLAKSGGIQAVHGSGHVVVQENGGPEIAASRLNAELSGEGRLRTVAMNGSVSIRRQGSTGSAEAAVLHFNPAGQPQQVELQHAVRLEDTGSGNGTRSTLEAERVVALLATRIGGHTELNEATATGGATVRMVEQTGAPSAAKRGSAADQRTTVLSADSLRAVTAGEGKGKRYISVVDGKGHTRIDQSDGQGGRRTSIGEQLHLFLQPPASQHAGRQNGTLQLAVQTGDVTVQQHTPAPPAHAPGAPGHEAAAQDTTAHAGRAEFDGSTGRLILTGSPTVTGTGVQLSADRVALQQGSGDAEAQGSVKGSFLQAGIQQQPGGEVTHVLADRATVAGSGGAARFFGGARAARMWNASAQVDAPEIDLDRTSGTLKTRSQEGGSTAFAHLLLSGEGSSGGSGKVRQSGPIRISGREMTMAAASGDIPGRVEVNREARLQSGDTDLSADHVTATLRAASRASGPRVPTAVAVVPGSGSVESVLATGNVRLQQPGRSGTGDRLIYTTADGRYQLTGSPSVPPTITDSLRGTVSGDRLIFHAGDDSVEIVGEAGHRVHTETNSARPLRNR